MLKQRVGILFRGFVSRDPNFLKRAYITYIRPLLEYCTIIWNPTLKNFIDKIESVQRNFTKRIPTLASLSYLERLDSLQLESLELRRLRFDLIYYFKILHNLTPHDPTDFFTFHNPPESSRQSSPILVRPTKGSNSFFSTFSYRAITCYNTLSCDIKNQNSLASFKKMLSNVNLKPFLYGSCFTYLNDFKCFM